MKRSLNYTGRRRIALSDVAITVAGSDASGSFTATLNLATYEFPASARVFVEAYRRMEWMRFDFGTAAQLVPPVNRRLSRFESLEGVLFRLRVVSPGGPSHGKLLAEADSIPVQLSEPAEEKRRTLLPVEPAALQGELFRVDFSGERPILLVERELGGDWQSAAASPLFESLVYPAVLRTVITELLRDEWPEEDEDSAGWQRDWARLLESLPGFVEPPDREEDYDDWKDTLVEAFCRQHRMLDRFNISWGTGPGR
jgi:hypothetical protein